MEGMRQVTGSDEPAIRGKPIRRAVSTISLAQSQRHDRCLSLNTGTPTGVAEHLDNLLEELVAGILRSAPARCGDTCRARR